jgi:Na+-transporting methylmalonyl-CoA/oxaloacetate decarboxylase gamma subunit
MTITATNILAGIGIVYLVLTVLVYVSDRWAQAEYQRYTEDKAFRRFVDTMRDLEERDNDQAGNA